MKNQYPNTPAKEPKHINPIEESEGIYADVNRSISDLIKFISQNNKDSKLVKEQNAAKSQMEELEKKTTQYIEQLRRNSEWKILTIAFYGETNAGKSTLIETLRILLGEKSKLDQQEKFLALQQRLNLNEQNLQTLEHQIASHEKYLLDIKTELAETIKQYDKKEADLTEQATKLQKDIDAQKATAKWFQKIIFWFKKSPRKSEIQIAKNTLSEQRKNFEKQSLIKTTNAQKNMEIILSKAQAVSQELRLLEALQDGEIIGDGRSDFTRETKEYVFEAMGQTFQILDVPGIEGSETKVNEQIAKAVQRAHVVFYVTCKAAPPQSGDDGRAGTLEKIRAHLHDQAEVWTIFNKRITNPRQMENDNIVNSDDLESINKLNEKMSTHLGDSYRGNIIVSALPAFLSVANTLAPRFSFDTHQKPQDHVNNRQKFLNALSREQILERSGLEGFRRQLTGSLITDHREKIRHSNRNKIGTLLADICDVIKKLHLGKFQPLAANLKNEVNNSSKQLKMSLNNLKSRLNNRSEQEIEYFKIGVRKRIYEKINDDISNKDFENTLKTYIEEGQLKLSSILTQKFAAEISTFQQECRGIFDRFKQHVNELNDGYSNICRTRHESSFSLNIEIDNGINLEGILTATGALTIGLAFPPTTGLAIAMLALNFVVQIFKSLFAFFSTDYKKSQQRQSADKNIDNICEKIRGVIESSLVESTKPLESIIKKICSGLEETLLQTEQICQSLDSAHQKIMLLSASLKAQGTHQ